MRYLTDIEIQTIVDDESTDAIRRHVEDCENCGARVAERRRQMTELGDSPRRIQQLIDRDRPSRYRLSNFGPDGALDSAISQDPAASRRTQLIRVDGRNYVINLTPVREPLLSLPQIAQAQIEAVITMM